MNPIVTTEIRSDAQAYANKRREGQFRVVCQKSVSGELSLIFSGEIIVSKTARGKRNINKEGKVYFTHH